MGQRGTPISNEQVERIKQLAIDTSNTAAIARAVGVSRATVLKYVGVKDEFDEVRHEKRVELIGAVADEFVSVRQLYLNHLKEPAVIAAANAKDSAVIVGVLTDKHQLVTGEATERTEHTNGDDVRAKFSHQIDELERRRAEHRDRGDDRSGT
jgi:AcrR family transcriptional regulator